ncbi:SsrA-binding protein [Candidatus Saccharibacteria bacterium]|nr:SsrA-binding protein [Candidatus Saccharibacteria bacterium]
MKSKSNPSTIVNRRARYDYSLGDELVVGVALKGDEVRAARDHRMQLKGAYVTVRRGELWLVNASFSVRAAEGETTVRSEPVKLLATKKQIESLKAEKVTGKTIVPVRVLTAGRFIKLVIAVGTGKREYDKRHSIRKRESDREARKLMKVGR